MNKGRLVYLLFVLWGITLGTYALLEIMPGDPAEIILRHQNETVTADNVGALREQMGLDAPFWVRYGNWLASAARGDWGRSWRTGEPVWMALKDRLWATMELALSSLILVIALSIAMGVVAALFQNSIPDQLIRIVAVLFCSMPSYWLALLLIYFFSLKISVFPVAGRGTWAHVVLPSLTLAISVAMLQGRVLRSALIQVLSTDYIRFAVAQGLHRPTIYFHHIMRNVLPTMVTLWGASLGQLMGGAVIVESIFAWPGLGRLTVTAVMGRDVPQVQAIVFFLAVVFVAVHQLVDLLHGKLDPKVGKGR